MGKSFKQIVLDDIEKDVFVFFYMPTCGKCKQLASLWEQVAIDLKDVPNIVLTKIDMIANDVEAVKLPGHHIFKLFPKGQKATITDFDGG